MSCRGAVGLWFTGIFLRLRARLDDLAGGAVRLSAACCVGGRRSSQTRPRAGPSHMHLVGGWRLAVGGWARSDASVRVTAHAFGLAAGGRVWWVPKIKSRASGGLLGKGRLRSDSKCCGPRRFGSSRDIRCARGRAALLGGGRCLWSPSVLGSLPRQRLTEADRSGGVQPHRCCCGPVSSGWTPPARSAWLRPRDAARNPEHNTTIGVEDPPKPMVGTFLTVPARMVSARRAATRASSPSSVTALSSPAPPPRSSPT